MSEKKESVRMKFGKPQSIDGVRVYEADEVYEIPAASVERWQKRGGIIVNKREASSFEKSQAEEIKTQAQIEQAQKEADEKAKADLLEKEKHLDTEPNRRAALEGDGEKGETGEDDEEIDEEVEEEDASGQKKKTTKKVKRSKSRR